MTSFRIVSALVLATVVARAQPPPRVSLYPGGEPGWYNISIRENSTSKVEGIAAWAYPHHLLDAPRPWDKHDVKTNPEQLKLMEGSTWYMGKYYNARIGKIKKHPEVSYYPIHIRPRSKG